MLDGEEAAEDIADQSLTFPPSALPAAAVPRREQPRMPSAPWTRVFVRYTTASLMPRAPQPILRSWTLSPRRPTTHDQATSGATIMRKREKSVRSRPSPSPSVRCGGARACTQTRRVGRPTSRQSSQSSRTQKMGTSGV